MLRIGEVLRKETVGGIVLVAAAVVALTWANSPISDSYFALRDFRVGYEPWHLELSLGAWAADGLLAIFFLVELELKLRIFLLTLAVVDDLLAISIIAAFYTSDLQVGPLLLALIPLAVYTFLAQKYRRFFGAGPAAAWVILLPLGVITWALVHASGIHATVAGVLLGFAIPVIRSQASGGPSADPGLSEIFVHRFRPISAGIAVPVFAFLLRLCGRGRLGGPDLRCD